MIEKGKGPIYFDTETCGLHGPIVTIQYAQGDGAIYIHEVWKSPIEETLLLITQMAENDDGIIGFNLTFDWFHICQTYTTLALAAKEIGLTALPEDHITRIAELEMLARDGDCVKPVTACDLMLIARKTTYQSTMNRSDIRIRKIPTLLAKDLAEELETRIILKDIYFARRKDQKESKWKVLDCLDAEGNYNPDFKDIVLRFAPSSALKVLVCDALGVDPNDILLFKDISVDKAFLPEEFGYAPFAMCHRSKISGGWNGAWPDCIKYHISHWAYNNLARKYAIKDVEYLPQLYRFFGSPEMGDDDSILACMVGAVRWHGFKIDVEGMIDLREKAKIKAAAHPVAPGASRRYIEQVLDVTELVALRGSTKKTILEDMATNPRWTQIPCEACNVEGLVAYGSNEGYESIGGPEDDPDWESQIDAGIKSDIESKVREEFDTLPHAGKCEVCDGKKYFRHPASFRAQEVLDARSAVKEIELYDKLILAGRLHASFVIIGTLSSRMAGADKLNAQGIKKTKEVRSKFGLAFPGYTLCGGDFKSFEVVLADAVYNDPKLRTALQTKNVCTGCKGSSVDKKGNPCPDCDPPGSGTCNQSIHGLFGTFVYPPDNYVDILNTKGSAFDKYTRSKSAVFAMLYGGEAYTLMTRLGVPIDVAENAYHLFTSEFTVVGDERRKVTEMFCSMRQVNGIGTKVEWHDPADYIESVFGFRRYFTLENSICETLFKLANKPPLKWKQYKFKVIRSKRLQTAGGAVQSALYGAAFQIQAGNTRAAANHVIQSAGAQVTKYLQRRIWDIQPVGIHKFVVLPMNIHDEILTPTLPEYIPLVASTVANVVEEFRPRVPLIAIDWSDNLDSWADK